MSDALDRIVSRACRAVATAEAVDGVVGVAAVVAGVGSAAGSVEGAARRAALRSPDISAVWNARSRTLRASGSSRAARLKKSAARRLSPRFIATCPARNRP